MIQQSKINGFIKSITDVADEKKAKLDAETRDILAGERRQLELAAKKSADEYYRVRSTRVKLEAGRRISDTSAEYRKQVFARRGEIERQVLSGVAERLKKFTESGDYEAFLLGSAKRIAAEFDGSFTLLMRPEDMKYQAALLAEFPSAEVKEDASIAIGGLKGRSDGQSLLVDDTLDSRLKQQTKWFEENSGLYISMGL